MRVTVQCVQVHVRRRRGSPSRLQNKYKPVKPQSQQLLGVVRRENTYSRADAVLGEACLRCMMVRVVRD